MYAVLVLDYICDYYFIFSYLSTNQIISTKMINLYCQLVWNQEPKFQAASWILLLTHVFQASVMSKGSVLCL